ncbi:MAG: hypothetical protein H5T69_10690 [Chloroflexi bacterium]|nr:hypothetical protein [Chloroflexota bacterium]
MYPSDLVPNYGPALRGWELGPGSARTRAFATQEAGPPWAARLLIVWSVQGR